MYDMIMILSMTPDGTLPRSHLPWSTVMTSVLQRPGMTPNWSKLENSVMLLGATILYAAMAESFINTIEVVLDSVEMKEEFLGIKLFLVLESATWGVYDNSEMCGCLTGGSQIVLLAEIRT
jgi:hypothetical protein